MGEAGWYHVTMRQIRHVEESVIILRLVQNFSPKYCILYHLLFLLAARNVLERNKSKNRKSAEEKVIEQNCGGSTKTDSTRNGSE